jgi:hypothetical protein
MRVTAGWVLAWSGLWWAGAAGKAAAPEATEVTRLVQQLSATSAASRDGAERLLLERGSTILPAVVAARAGAAGETAFRLECIQHRLELMATAESVDAAIDTLTLGVAAVEPLAGGRKIRITLRAAWGPALEPLAMRLPAHTVMADGPAAEALPPVHRQAIVEPMIVSGATAVSLPLLFRQVDPPLESLATLRGTITLWIAGRDHDFELPLDGLPRSMRIGRATVTIVDTTIREARLDVTARIGFDEPTESLASHRPWLAARLIEVVGKDGQPLARTAQRTAARSEQGLTAVASFAVPAGVESTAVRGFQMRWRLPMAIHEVPVNFLVREVRLPPAEK